MERTGFAPAPLRGEGALESATMRPQMAAHYEQADLIRQAALLAVGISQAQAFLDGNKRTAFISCRIFMLRNGLTLTDPLGFAKQLELVAERSERLDEATADFEEWLRQSVTDWKR